MTASVSDTPLVEGSTAARLLHASDRAIYTCAATGWSAAARKALRIELLTLRVNLARYASALRSDARRLQPVFADDPSCRLAQLQVERVFAVPRILAARLAACGDDREELYRIRDEFQEFQRELEELDAVTELFPVDPRSEVGDDLAPRSNKTGHFLRKWKIPGIG
jgi:hypothetical protein